VLSGIVVEKQTYLHQIDEHSVVFPQPISSTLIFFNWLRPFLETPPLCKLFHSMRHFFDNYLTYITLCLPKVKVFESACDALSAVAEREKQCRHYVK